MGEPNIPIDKELMQSAAFFELLDRLKRHSEEHQRDHWSAAYHSQLYGVVCIRTAKQRGNQDVLSAPLQQGRL